MNNDNKHFIYIFWFIVGLTAVTIAYNIAITFIAIPEKNIRFADTFQGFLLGTAMGTGISYLIGSSAEKTKQNNSVNQTNINTDV